MFVDEFEIVLDSLTIEDVGGWVNFLDATEVANISQAEYEALGNYTHKQHVNKDDRNKFSRDRQKSTQPRVPQRKALSEKERNAQSQCRDRHRSSSLSYNSRSSSHSGGKAVHFDSIQADSSENLDKTRSKPSARIIRDVRPIETKLIDLIPPDTTAFDLHMDEILANTPETDESSDTVSCSSSDCSYFTCFEDLDCQITVKDLLPNDGRRPGVQLDMKLVAPPTEDTVLAMPKPTIYKCGKSKCGFTTSNSTNIKLHSCYRSKAEYIDSNTSL